MDSWAKKRREVGGCTSCKRKAENGRSRCQTCLKERRKYMKEYVQRPGIRERQRKESREYKAKIRKQLVEILGGKCVCCGISIYEFLNFDHKNNDGAQHRKELGKAQHGNPLYVLMLKDPNVLAKFQLLCWNCNCAKGIYGYCPHSLEKNDNSTTAI